MDYIEVTSQKVRVEIFRLVLTSKAFIHHKEHEEARSLDFAEFLCGLRDLRG